MVILYSNDCPNCQSLKAELNKAHIEYQECKDIDKIINMGLNELPVLEYYGKLLNLREAISWIKKGVIS